jgi:hypothetical protein
MSNTRIFIASLLSFVMICFFSYGQHVEEIRAKLYRDFDPVKWRGNNSHEEDYIPVDYSEWDVSPKADEFYEAFEGYYILTYFLSKRNSEIKLELDEKGKIAYMNAHQKWMLAMDRQCNEVWKSNELGYSMMVLNYLYCVNLKTRLRVDSLGGGIPPNKKLDELASIEKYKIGNDRSLYLDLIPEDEKDKYKTFIAMEKVMISGVSGIVKVTFHDNKLSSLEIVFKKCSCESKLYDYANEVYGKHRTSSHDPITLSGTYFWKGASVGLRLNYDEESATMHLWALK